jgi:hypothetical protein
VRVLWQKLLFQVTAFYNKKHENIFKSRERRISGRLF